MPDQLHRRAGADDQLHVRELHVREVDSDARTFTGIAVPYDQQVPINDWFGTYNETFARGSVQDSDDALLYWRHSDPIGRITSHRDTDGGWEVTARISETPLGDEAYTLLRDGVVTSMSVGFQSVSYEVDDESGDITRTAVRVREVSLVPMPAYDGATVTDVRHRQPISNDHTPQGDPVDTEEFQRRLDAALTQERAENGRQFDALTARLGEHRGADAPVDNRSAGQWIKAFVRGDESTIQAYEDLMERAYGPDGQGGVLGDQGGLRPAWVGDLTRLIEDNSILSGIFSSGTLPDQGETLEFGELDTNTTQVAEQVNEGDDLVYGKVKVKTRTAPVKTIGGYTQLSRKEIERSSVNMLDLNLRGMAIAAGRNKNVNLRAAVATLRAARVDADRPNARTAVTITDQTKYTGWVGGIIDAAGLYEDQGLSLDVMLVDKATFKGLANMTDTTGRPLMTVSGTGVNAVGTIAPEALGGNLAGVIVRVDPKQADATPQFVNKLALRAYNSPLVQLTDSNIINLTQAFSVYYYAAIAAEIPGALIPVVTKDPAAPAA
ncbi:HK97 family phage prohead protease [Curtobacterium sp. VKM Ac-1376]|uniref:HK97 family phage prohead protease n=1 Tax=Curtobacterium sp. VKM Ac-1376 TaxID=123312 RepID=UPI00188D6FF1|nr:HK97 family phage prohead protease [Curtobacterium sp. VKM Ac-1376]MBF4613269.1 HK97 family phage prohead protease [Curtobacterium sp. VKM Ac-1376]